MKERRFNREELLKLHPSWNESKHDIVKTFYGDVPLIIYDETEHEKYLALKDKTIANIECASDYLYCVNGTYFEYRTLLGNIYITESGNVIGGNISITFNGFRHSVMLNSNGLTILRITSGKVKGFCNQNGIGSPTRKSNTEELSEEIIYKILNKDLDIYGDSVKNFMSTCKDIYEKDKTNYILEKTFNL